jgi:hypothetical protein
LGGSAHQVPPESPKKAPPTGKPAGGDEAGAWKARVSDADSVVPGAVVVLNHEAPHSCTWPSATQETQRRRR